MCRQVPQAHRGGMLTITHIQPFSAVPGTASITPRPATRPVRPTPFVRRWRAKVGVHLASTRLDGIAARDLFAEQRRWTEELGLRVADHDPDVETEYSDPFGFYRERGAVMLATVSRVELGLVTLRTVGHLSVGVVALRDRGEGDAELRRMFVQPWARGLGAGPALLSHAIETARDRGYRRIVLESWPGPMDAAISMYRLAGFTETAPLHEYPGVLGMELPLGSGR